MVNGGGSYLNLSKFIWYNSMLVGALWFYTNKQVMIKRAKKMHRYLKVVRCYKPFGSQESLPTKLDSADYVRNRLLLLLRRLLYSYFKASSSIHAALIEKSTQLINAALSDI